MKILAVYAFGAPTRCYISHVYKEFTIIECYCRVCYKQERSQMRVDGDERMQQERDAAVVNPEDGEETKTEERR